MRQIHPCGHVPMRASQDLIKQGIIHNTRLAMSSVGSKRDVEVVANLYQETWWLHQV